MRHSQYVSRYTLPHAIPPEPVLIEKVVPRVIPQHQDFFVHELTAEVNELKSR
jgi:chromosome segregation ATPase